MPSSTALAALALVTTLLLAGCAGRVEPGAPQQPDDPVTAPASGTGPATHGNVTGIVTDAAGKPRSGVMVQATSLDNPPRPVPEMAITTDGSGRYTWSLQPGRYELNADGAKMTVTVTAGANVQADLKAIG